VQKRSEISVLTSRRFLADEPLKVAAILTDRQQGYYSTYEQTLSTKTPLRLTRTVRKGPSPSPHHSEPKLLSHYQRL
jgi:hypothetical protein